MIRSTNDRRVCPHCNTEFTPNSGKQVYCCDSCRGSAHIARAKQESEHLKGALQEQADELKVLKTSPKVRKEVVQEVNPDWQLVSQKVDAQRRVYYTIVDELAALDKKVRDLTNIAPIIGIGVTIALLVGLLPIAVGFDSKKGRSLGMTFYVLSIVSLLLFSLLGYSLGKSAGNRRLTNDPALASHLADLYTRQSELGDLLVVGKQVLEALEHELTGIPQFTTNRVTFVEEVSDQLSQNE